jgi:peptide deformylase
MARRPILSLPDQRLFSVSKPVGEVTDDIRRLSDDMLETMYAAPGIGLAAIQIGEPVRLVVIDLAKKDEERQPMVLVDPEITWASDELRIHEEGCLSIPEYYEEVERPDRVRYRYRTLAGDTVEAEANGMLATCLQHEIDHLDGKLFIDHLSRLKRSRVLKKFEKAAKRDAVA